jgi:hypothetical protein
MLSSCKRPENRLISVYGLRHAKFPSLFSSIASEFPTNPHAEVLLKCELCEDVLKKRVASYIKMFLTRQVVSIFGIQRRDACEDACLLTMVVIKYFLHSICAIVQPVFGQQLLSEA